VMWPAGHILRNDLAGNFHPIGTSRRRAGPSGREIKAEVMKMPHAERTEITERREEDMYLWRIGEIPILHKLHHFGKKCPIGLRVFHPIRAV